MKLGLPCTWRLRDTDFFFAHKVWNGCLDFNLPGGDDVMLVLEVDRRLDEVCAFVKEVGDIFG